MKNTAFPFRASAAVFIQVLLVMLLVTSCSHDRKTYRSDPPLPTSRKTVQRPYTVNGERYQPLSSHDGFSQSGIASWYGSDFHGRMTSSGESYDMHAMTAAHKTLPLGVHVKVSNLSNGREAVVRINDRGPFIAGRIIDLSYLAAKRVGIVEAGTAPVRIEALGYPDLSENDRTVYKAPASYDAGLFGIQVGAFTSPENARKMARDVKRRHGSATTREAYINNTRYYRVSAGNFKSLKEAELYRENSSDSLVSAGFIVALD